MLLHGRSFICLIHRVQDGIHSYFSLFLQASSRSSGLNTRG